MALLKAPLTLAVLGKIVIGIEIDVRLAHFAIIIEIERVRHIVPCFILTIGYQAVVEIAVGGHFGSKKAFVNILETDVAVILDAHRVLIIKLVIGSKNQTQDIVITLAAAVIVLMPQGVGGDILGDAVFLQPAVLKVANCTEDIQPLVTVIPKKGIIGAGHFALEETAAQVTAPSFTQWLACLNPNHALHRRIILGAGGVDDLDTYDVL